MLYSNTIRKVVDHLTPLQKFCWEEKRKMVRGQLMTITQPIAVYCMEGRIHELDKLHVEYLEGNTTVLVLDYIPVNCGLSHKSGKGNLIWSSAPNDTFAYIVLYGEYNYIVLEHDLPSFKAQTPSRSR